MFLLLVFPILVSSCGDVCNENDDAYHPNIVYNVAPDAKCASGYQQFLRPGYTWCLKVFPAQGLNYTQAQAICEADGAVVSGYQNGDEGSYLFNSGTNIVRAYNLEVGSVWIGLQLREECNVDNFYELAACTPLNVNAYYWTDGHTTGYSQVSWDQNGPTNIPYQCVFYAILPEKTQTIIPTQIQNYDCSVTNPEYAYQNIQAVLCGKSPT